MWARIHHAVALNRAGRSPHSRPRAPADPDPARPPTPRARTPTTPPARTRAPAHAPPPPAPVCRRDADFCLKSQVLQQKVASQRGTARREGGNARRNARVLPRTGPYRVPVPAHPACPYRCAVEMPISVSNLRFCNRKWHLGREHGERAGGVARDEVGRGSAGGGRAR